MPTKSRLYCCFRIYVSKVALSMPRSFRKFGSNAMGLLRCESGWRAGKGTRQCQGNFLNGRRFEKGFLNKLSLIGAKFVVIFLHLFFFSLHYFFFFILRDASKDAGAYACPKGRRLGLEISFFISVWRITSPSIIFADALHLFFFFWRDTNLIFEIFTLDWRLVCDIIWSKKVSLLFDE